MSLQVFKAVSRFISIPLLFIVCQTNLTVASDEMDFDKLVDVARRYNCPQPQESNQLVIGWGGSWRSVGQSNSQDAGIYRPAFVLEKAGKTASVLMGFATVSCKSRKNIPSTRDFILSSPDEGEDGYTISHNHVSSFETCIQLARLGQKELANQLWNKFSKSEYIDGGHPHEGIRVLVSKPKLLLARSIFEYNKNQTLRPDSDWQEILKTLEELRNEFPELFSDVREDYNEHYRNQFIDDLKITVAAKSPEKSTVEASLMAWANSTGEMRHLGFYHSRNVKVDAPARDIFNRGTESIKPLVDLVDDRRITLHVRQAIMNAREYRLRVGDLAKKLLEEMTGANSPTADRQSAIAPNLWKDWFASVDLSNESEFFKTAAFNIENGKAYRVPIRVLEARHPNSFINLVQAVAEHAQPTTYCHYLTYSIRDSKTISVAEKSSLLSMLLRQLPDKKKRSAVQALAHVNKDLTAELVLPLVKQLPEDVEEPYWTSEAANLTHVVMHLKDVEVWTTYLQAAKKSSVGLRMEMMNPMNYSYIARTNLDFRLAFLSSFLDDRTVRVKKAGGEKFSGPCAAFTFEKISVQNFVAMKLASLILKSEDWPDDSWTSARWDQLRKEVRSELTMRNLPDISHTDE